MDQYAFYVYSAYIIAAISIATLSVFSIKSYMNAKKKLRDIEKLDGKSSED